MPAAILGAALYIFRPISKRPALRTRWIGAVRGGAKSIYACHVACSAQDRAQSLHCCIYSLSFMKCVTSRNVVRGSLVRNRSFSYAAPAKRCNNVRLVYAHQAAPLVVVFVLLCLDVRASWRIGIAVDELLSHVYCRCLFCARRWLPPDLAFDREKRKSIDCDICFFFLFFF